MRDEGVRDLVAQGFPALTLRAEYALDLRYVGQGYELTVTLDAVLPKTAADLQRVRAAFDAQHEQLTGLAAPGERVEIVNYRVVSVAPVPQAPVTSPFAGGGTLAGAARGTRAIFNGGAHVTAPLYERTVLPEGAVIDGPAIILQADATTLIGRDQTATVIANGFLEIQVSLY